MPLESYALHLIDRVDVPLHFIGLRWRVERIVVLQSHRGLS